MRVRKMIETTENNSTAPLTAPVLLKEINGILDFCTACTMRPVQKQGAMVQKPPVLVQKPPVLGCRNQTKGGARNPPIPPYVLSHVAPLALRTLLRPYYLNWQFSGFGSLDWAIPV